MKHFLLLLFTTITLPAAYSQSVELYFPHFAGAEWVFTAFRGEKQDTLAAGILDADGRAVLRAPGSHRNYRGMTRWLLAKGGGLDMIVAGGENFSVSCPEAQPSEDNIKYSGTRENAYLNERYKRQQDILGRIDAMRMATEAYRGDSALLPVFERELQRQEQAYKLLQEETAANPLYAARFAQIVDVTRGLPPVLASGREETAGLLKDFVLDRLDMEALYASGHWAGVLEQLMDWYSGNEENSPTFIPDMIRLVKRISSDEVYAALIEKIIVFCEKKDWHKAGYLKGFFKRD